MIIVVMKVISCVDFIARPSFRPVRFLNSFAFRMNLDPSINVTSPGPIIIRTIALSINITPKLTTINITGSLFFSL